MQKFTATDFQARNSISTKTKTKGKTVELCARLGAKLVNGKNYSPPA